MGLAITTKGLLHNSLFYNTSLLPDPSLSRGTRSIRNKNLKIVLYIITLVAFVSCSVQDTKEAEKPIAIAGEKQLSETEDSNFNFLSNAVKDSAFISKRLIESWAKDELFYQEAKQKLLPEDMNVEDEVEKYRKELINYKYEVKLIENNLDTTVSKEEVQAYYDANRDNFILKDNIAKVNYFKIPLVSKAIDKIKKAIYSSKPKRQRAVEKPLLAVCRQLFH